MGLSVTAYISKEGMISLTQATSYTDFVGELTAALYGHSNTAIHAAITSTLSTTGLNLGATTRLEAQFARLLCSRFNLQRVRFTNSGTEATLHAIQGARKFTRKRKVVVFSGGYHGACFYFPGGGPVENSVDRQEWIVGRYNDVDATRELIEESGDVAAVLVEGMQGAGGCIPGSREFLFQCQESARKVGAVFALDEVMTSRLGPGGLQKIIGLEPDITILGKYLAGGISFGAFGGGEDIMRVYDPREQRALAHSGTFNNNTLGMAAGFAGLSQVYTPEVSVEFNKMGDKFRRDLQDVSEGTKMTITGLGTILAIHFLKDGKKLIWRDEDLQEDTDLKDLFWFEMMEEGFWIMRRGTVAMILGTTVEELDRFRGSVQNFLERHRDLVRI